jgi:surface protein
MMQKKLTSSFLGGKNLNAKILNTAQFKSVVEQSFGSGEIPLGGNAIRFVVQPTSTTTETRLFGASFSMKSIDRLTIDGAEVTPAYTYLFSDTNKHRIEVILNGNFSSGGQMFNDCDDIIAVTMKYLDCSKGNTITAMFKSCSRIESVPYFDTHTIVNFGYTFAGCTNLKNVATLDTSIATILYYMFSECSSLERIPHFNTSSGKAFNGMFRGCAKLKTVPAFDVSNATDMSVMFMNCTGLVELPEFYSAKNSTFTNSFTKCTSLEKITLLDFKSVTSANWTFNNCPELKYLLIKNIGTTSMESYDFSGIPKWGAENEENRQSMIDTLITYSYDRAKYATSSAKIYLHSNAKSRLTESEIAQITAKGYTIA